jgi:integrase
MYYFRLSHPDGQRTTAKSTGCTNRAAAERWVLDYLERSGRCAGGGRIRFDALARTFWSEEGRYVRLRRAHGHNLGASHVAHQTSIVKNYLLPMFERKYLDELSAELIENFLLNLFENGKPTEGGDRIPITARTVNSVRSCLSAILREAVRLGHLRYNPVTAVHTFKERPKPRGILSREELWKLLFAPGALENVWQGEKLYFLCTLVSAITGVRMGEVRALMPRNVHTDWINIEFGWDQKSGLVPPKWGKTRVCTIPPVVADALHGWITAEDIPEDGFIFRSERYGHMPVSARNVLSYFRGALEKIGIDRSERQRRNLVFHGLRHSLITAIRADQVDEWQAKSAVGHSSDEMFDRYSEHVSVEHLGEVRAFQMRLMEEPEVVGHN